MPIDIDPPVHAVSATPSSFTDEFSATRSQSDVNGDAEGPPVHLQQVPKRIRQIPKSFNATTFTNEIVKDSEIPKKRCAVCCRLLYPEEYCRLSSTNKDNIEK